MIKIDKKENIPGWSELFGGHIGWLDYNLLKSAESLPPPSKIIIWPHSVQVCIHHHHHPCTVINQYISPTILQTKCEPSYRIFKANSQHKQMGNLTVM